MSAIPEFRKTIPNEPPAPVIKIIIAADKCDLPTQPVVESISLSNFFGRRKAKNTPISSAITGSPINPKKVLKIPVPNGFVGKSETDLKTISNRGMIIGIKAFNAEGASFIFSIMSSSLLSGCGSIKIFEANIEAKIHAEKRVIELTANQTMITNPISASKIPAAAIGPGVGGTRQCVIVKPKLRAIAGPAN